MAISNFTLERIYLNYLDTLTNRKISKIVKISPYDYAFILFSKTQDSLIISLEPLHPYLLISSSYFKTLNESNIFLNNLKKYFENGTIIKFEKLKNDRILIFTIKKITPTYQQITNKLVIELIPHRTNAIILDENDVIITALKMSSSLVEESLIAKGVHYIFKDNEDKQITLNDTLETLKNKIGSSLYKDIVYRIEEENDTLENIIQEILNSKSYYLYNNDILSIPLHSKETRKISLEEISSIYKEKEVEKYKKEHYASLYHLVKHKLKGLRNKVINLNKDLIKNQNKKDYVEYGDLLYMYSSLYKKGMKEIELEGKKIPLDEKLSLSENASHYYKQYQKSKVALIELEKQKNIALEKIDFFEKIENQLTFASLNDMEEISEELKLQGYIKSQNKKKNQKNKDKIYSPHIFEYKNTKIGFGLSSFQNDYLTFSLSNKEDYFLHIKDHHGPHLIIFSSSLDEDVVLFAAELLVYLNSSTCGEVYLAKRKDVKKASGKIGLVNILSYSIITIKNIREESISFFKKLLDK